MIENGLLSIKQIKDLEICIFMYKYSNQCLSVALQNLFSIEATRVTTRSNSKYINSSFIQSNGMPAIYQILGTKDKE